MTDKQASQFSKLFLLLAFISFTCGACSMHIKKYVTFHIIATGGGQTHSVPVKLYVR